MREFLDIVASTSMLLIASSGLLLILGLMNVINMAHPGLMAVGAYAALVAVNRGMGVWVGIVLGALAASLVGLGVERLIVRRLYQRPLDTILATLAISLAITQIIILIFGRNAHKFLAPVSGTVTVAGYSYSTYKLTLIGLAILIYAALVLTARFTKIGLIARAVMGNEALAEGLGLNTRSVKRWTFAIGASLAGVSGVLIAPLFSLTPNIGIGYLIPAFLAVLLSGKTVVGLIIGALIISAGQYLLALLLNPTVASFGVVVLVVLLLRLFPNGFDRVGRFA